MQTNNIIDKNKSLITNLLAFLFVIIGIIINSQLLITIAIFALSGAITNWLAIHMLFEKIPFLYGSGIIPNRFEDFKQGIKNIMVEQFFSTANIEKILKGNNQQNLLNKIADHIDTEQAYELLIQAITESKLGSMLAMFGGTKILDNAKDEIMQAIDKILHKIINDIKTHQEDLGDISKEFHKKTAKIIDNRLAELTPQQVKDIIAKMIKQHLGWLVVWGGVFGGLIGSCKFYLSVIT